MARLAVLSFHTSPLTQAGTGDGGGMNVYVRELAASLARNGDEVDVFTRLESPTETPVVDIEPGVRVHRVPAGPPRQLDKGDLEEHVDAFTQGVLARMLESPDPYDAIHANYWLSGIAGHALKHELDVPLLVTFHTVERIKAGGAADPSSPRAVAEDAIVACADAVLATASRWSPSASTTPSSVLGIAPRHAERSASILTAHCSCSPDGSRT